MESFKTFLPFWEKLTKTEQKELTSNTTITSYTAGQPVHRGANDCIGILLVKSGTLRTYMLSEDGREITLFRMRKGDVCVLSASCILNAVTFDVFIDAAEDSKVLQINSNYFQKLTDSNIYAENFMYKVAIERFSDVMWIMEQVLFMSIDKRLAIFLLDEGPNIHMTHDEIARHLGTAREVISRMLKYFVDENLVILSRGNVTVSDRKSLMKFI